MEIIKEKNGTAVTMSLQGRLDTATAPQMEAELKKDMEEVTRLILDMRELEYLSSAGLRVILNAQKMMGKRYPDDRAGIISMEMRVHHE